MRNIFSALVLSLTLVGCGANQPASSNLNGREDEDVIIKKMRQKFSSGVIPTVAQLAVGLNWRCKTRSGVKDNARIEDSNLRFDTIEGEITGRITFSNYSQDLDFRRGPKSLDGYFNLHQKSFAVMLVGNQLYVEGLAADSVPGKNDVAISDPQMFATQYMSCT